MNNSEDFNQEQTFTGCTVQEKKVAEDWEKLQQQSDSNVQDYRNTSAKQIKKILW